jgi:hypothetical protein
MNEVSLKTEIKGVLFILLLTHPSRTRALKMGMKQDTLHDARMIELMKISLVIKLVMRAPIPIMRSKVIPANFPRFSSDVHSAKHAIQVAKPTPKDTLSKRDVIMAPLSVYTLTKVGRNEDKVPSRIQNKIKVVLFFIFDSKNAPNKIEKAAPNEFKPHIIIDKLLEKAFA